MNQACTARALQESSRDGYQRFSRQAQEVNQVRSMVQSAVMMHGLLAAAQRRAAIHAAYALANLAAG